MGDFLFFSLTSHLFSEQFFLTFSWTLPNKQLFYPYKPSTIRRRFSYGVSHQMLPVPPAPGSFSAGSEKLQSMLNIF
jgi:hypothetical protein